jgi:Rrf2 family protein
LALHTMAYLASDPEGTHATREIAEELAVSEAHLAKVLQRLGRAGLVRSQRGPGGGFTLAKAPEEITLLQVYEVTEGPLTTPECLLGQPVCQGHCILGDLLEGVGHQVRDYLATTRLSDLRGGLAQRRSYA